MNNEISLQLANLDNKLLYYKNLNLEKEIQLSCYGKKNIISVKKYIHSFYSVFTYLTKLNIFHTLNSKEYVSQNNIIKLQKQDMTDNLFVKQNIFPILYQCTDPELKDRLFYYRRNDKDLNFVNNYTPEILIDFLDCKDNLNDYKIFSDIFNDIKKRLIDKSTDKFNYITEELTIGYDSVSQHQTAIIVEYSKSENILTLCLFDPEGLTDSVQILFFKLLTEYINRFENITTHFLYEDESVSDIIGIQKSVGHKNALCVIFSYLWLYIFYMLRKKDISIREWIKELESTIKSHVLEKESPIKYMYTFAYFIISEKILPNIKDQYYDLQKSEIDHIMKYYTKFTNKFKNIKIKDIKKYLTLNYVIEALFCEIITYNRLELGRTYIKHYNNYCEHNNHCDSGQLCIANRCVPNIMLFIYKYQVQKNNEIISFEDLMYYKKDEEKKQFNQIDELPIILNKLKHLLKIDRSNVDIVEIKENYENDTIEIYSPMDLFHEFKTDKIIDIDDNIKLVKISQEVKFPDNSTETQSSDSIMTKEFFIKYNQQQERTFINDRETFLEKIKNSDYYIYLKYLEDTEPLMYLYQTKQFKNFYNKLLILKNSDRYLYKYFQILRKINIFTFFHGIYKLREETNLNDYLEKLKKNISKEYYFKILKTVVDEKQYLKEINEEFGFDYLLEEKKQIIDERQLNAQSSSVSEEKRQMTGANIDSYLFNLKKTDFKKYLYELKKYNLEKYLDEMEDYDPLTCFQELMKHEKLYLERMKKYNYYEYLQIIKTKDYNLYLPFLENYNYNLYLDELKSTNIQLYINSIQQMKYGNQIDRMKYLNYTDYEEYKKQLQKLRQKEGIQNYENYLAIIKETDIDMFLFEIFYYDIERYFLTLKSVDYELFKKELKELRDTDNSSYLKIKTKIFDTNLDNELNNI